MICPINKQVFTLQCNIYYIYVYERFDINICIIMMRLFFSGVCHIDTLYGTSERNAKVVRRQTPTTMSDRVSVEGSDARPLRDGSDARPLRDASDARPVRRPSMNDLHIPPVIGAPHRRMSRIDGGLGLGLPRYGYRRPSVASSFRIDHSSQLHHPHKVANTYRLAPKDDERFSSSRVQKVINVVLR